MCEPDVHVTLQILTYTTDWLLWTESSFRPFHRLTMQTDQKTGLMLLHVQFEVAHLVLLACATVNHTCQPWRGCLCT